jgi:blue copper oxidase
VLNGANARIYKLGWSNGAPLTVIATDGGLLESPVTAPYVMLAPGERVELWADFSGEAVGGEVKLVSLPFTGVEAGAMEMMSMMHAGAGLPNGTAFDIMTFAITEAVTHTFTLPATLLPVETTRSGYRGQRRRAAHLRLCHGRCHELDDQRARVRDGRRRRRRESAIWRHGNLGTRESDGGAPAAASGMDPGAHTSHGSSTTTSAPMRDFMAHPVHLHGVHFQVLNRQVDDAQRAGWESVKDGLVDAGLERYSAGDAGRTRAHRRALRRLSRALSLPLP